MKATIFLRNIILKIGFILLSLSSFSQESTGGIPLSWQDSSLLSNFKTNQQVISLPNLNNQLEQQKAFAVYNAETQEESFVVLGNGSVGIGTTAVNGAKLSVDGTIRARRVNVDAASIVWSDFVFEPNYNLIPLIQLENFIVKNKHLPDVPSASEVKEKGIDLAQMDAILLQKIEELTLYIIELKKEMNKLKEEQKKQ